MYPECVAFLRKTIRVREIVILVHLSHSHGFAQKRNAFRIHGTAPLEILKGELGHITPSTRLGPTGIRKSSQNASALMLILKAT